MTTGRDSRLCRAGEDLAREARLLCVIPFHYRALRLHYLYEVVRALSELLVRRVTVVVMTNTTDDDELARIDRICAHFLDRQDIGIDIHPELDDPWNLGWCHKPILGRLFMGDDAYTHFVYLEDDMRLSHWNLTYFMGARALLARQGLIPSFVRVEYNFSDANVYATDWLAQGQIAGKPAAEAAGQRFLPADNPYIAMFILDRALAEEHVATRSFDRLRSREVMDWDPLARAAMGLSFENVPAGFPSRYVVPVDADGQVMTPAWVYHLPNNYANAPAEIPFGKTPMTRLFA